MHNNLGTFRLQNERNKIEIVKTDSHNLYKTKIMYHGISFISKLDKIV